MSVFDVVGRLASAVHSYISPPPPQHEDAPAPDNAPAPDHAPDNAPAPDHAPDNNPGPDPAPAADSSPSSSWWLKAALVFGSCVAGAVAGYVLCGVWFPPPPPPAIPPPAYDVFLAKIQKFLLERGLPAMTNFKPVLTPFVQAAQAAAAKAAAEAAAKAAAAAAPCSPGLLSALMSKLLSPVTGIKQAIGAFMTPETGRWILTNGLTLARAALSRVR